MDKTNSSLQHLSNFSDTGFNIFFNTTGHHHGSLENITQRMFEVLAFPACVGIVFNACLLVVTVRNRSCSDSRPASVAYVALADLLAGVSYILGYLLIQIHLNHSQLLLGYVALTAMNGASCVARSWSVLWLLLDRLLLLWRPRKYEAVLPGDSVLTWLVCLPFWLPAISVAILTGFALLQNLPLSVSTYRDSLRLTPSLATPLVCTAAHVITRRSHMGSSSCSSCDFSPLNAASRIEMRKTRMMIFYFTFISILEAIALVTSLVFHSKQIAISGYTLGTNITRYYHIAEAVGQATIITATVLDPVLQTLRHRNAFCSLLLCKRVANLYKKYRDSTERVNDGEVRVNLTTAQQRD